MIAQKTLRLGGVTYCYPDAECEEVKKMNKYSIVQRVEQGKVLTFRVSKELMKTLFREEEQNA